MVVVVSKRENEKAGGGRFSLEAGHTISTTLPKHRYAEFDKLAINLSHLENKLFQAPAKITDLTKKMISGVHSERNPNYQIIPLTEFSLLVPRPLF